MNINDLEVESFYRSLSIFKFGLKMNWVSSTQNKTYGNLSAKNHYWMSNRDLFYSKLFSSASVDCRAERQSLCSGQRCPARVQSWWVPEADDFLEEGRRWAEIFISSSTECCLSSSWLCWSLMFDEVDATIDHESDVVWRNCCFSCSCSRTPSWKLPRPSSERPSNPDCWWWHFALAQHSEE